MLKGVLGLALVGLPVAVRYCLCGLPAAKLAKHVRWLVHPRLLLFDFQASRGDTNTPQCLPTGYTWVSLTEG